MIYKIYIDIDILTLESHPVLSYNIYINIINNYITYHNDDISSHGILLQSFKKYNEGNQKYE